MTQRRLNGAAIGTSPTLDRAWVEGWQFADRIWPKPGETLAIEMGTAPYQPHGLLWAYWTGALARWLNRPGSIDELCDRLVRLKELDA